MDIALPFGCTLVISDASLPSQITQVVQEYSITCIGVTASVLGVLKPTTLCPPVRLIFTWSTEMPEDALAGWKQNQLCVCDLLISTDHWLCLYSFREKAQVPHVGWALPLATLTLSRFCPARQPPWLMSRN
uniref:Uncharacterized protein n=1 Tax=Eutreptiella gymnastica TaxID=73025 RepID=A0A7S1HYZ3_9EUGL